MYRARNQSGVDLLVCLDDLAALAPECRTTVTTTTSRDVESLSYLGTLNHAVNPTTKKER